MDFTDNYSIIEFEVNTVLVGRFAVPLFEFLKLHLISALQTVLDCPIFRCVADWNPLFVFVTSWCDVWHNDCFTVFYFLVDGLTSEINETQYTERSSSHDHTKSLMLSHNF